MSRSESLRMSCSSLGLVIGMRDVVGEAFLHRLDDDRPGRIGLGRRHADAFGFELGAQDVEQVARAEHLQRLRAVRAHLASSGADRGR